MPNPAGKHPFGQTHSWADTPRQTHHPRQIHPTGQTTSEQTPPGQTTLSGQTLLHLSLARHPLARYPHGRYLHPWADTPFLCRHPLLVQTPPSCADTPLGRNPLPNQTVTAADGTHPTEMHSCYFWRGQYKPSEI